MANVISDCPDCLSAFHRMLCLYPLLDNQLLCFRACFLKTDSMLGMQLRSGERLQVSPDTRILLVLSHVVSLLCLHTLLNYSVPLWFLSAFNEIFSSFSVPYKLLYLQPDSLLMLIRIPGSSVKNVFLLSCRSMQSYVFHHICIILLFFIIFSCLGFLSLYSKRHSHSDRGFSCWFNRQI